MRLYNVAALNCAYFNFCDLFLVQALLDIYLLENIEESAKHAIVSFWGSLLRLATNIMFVVS